LPIYAEVWGELATPKTAADDSFTMVGLLYRGYGWERIEDGDQVDEDWLFDPLSVG
jgi:hypothetical protein